MIIAANDRTDRLLALSIYDMERARNLRTLDSINDCINSKTSDALITQFYCNDARWRYKSASQGRQSPERTDEVLSHGAFLSMRTDVNNFLREMKVAKDSESITTLEKAVRTVGGSKWRNLLALSVLPLFLLASLVLYRQKKEAVSAER